MAVNVYPDDPAVLAAIRRACRSAGSQSAFAKAQGISPQYLCCILHGRRLAPARIVRAVGLERADKCMADRFWPRVDKRGPGECWPWIGYRDRDGYGQAARDGGHPMRATHQSLLVHGVHVPAGVLVLHRCHNPPCVNPAHLYLGTNTDNMRDMVRAGRSLRGVAHPNARLRDVDIRNIRALWGASRHLSQADRRRFTASRLSRMYGVCTTTIDRIVRRESWVHVEANL